MDLVYVQWSPGFSFQADQTCWYNTVSNLIPVPSVVVACRSWLWKMITRLLILLVLRLVGYVYEAMLVGTATYLSLLVLRVGIGCLYNYINLLVGMT